MEQNIKFVRFKNVSFFKYIIYKFTTMHFVIFFNSFLKENMHIYFYIYIYLHKYIPLTEEKTNTGKDTEK